MGHYRAQSAHRLETLRRMRGSDSAGVSSIHRETQNILLIARDSENPGAAVERSARLLDRVCTKYAFRRADFTDIHASMSLDECELQLLENELAIYNRIVMDVDTSGIIFSAH